MVNNKIIKEEESKSGDFKEKDNAAKATGDTICHESKVKNKMLLAHTQQGKKYRVENIFGGHILNSRLNSMGIVPGDIVKVVYQAHGGPMTLAVKGVRIALGRGIAHKIEVSVQE